MSAFSFRLRRPNFKALFDIRARLVLLTLILVVPLMVDRVRTLEQTRSRQIAEASTELMNVAQRGAQMQRDVVRAVEGVLRTASSIFLASRVIERPCALLTAGLKVHLSGIGNISIADRTGRIVCSTRPNAVGLNLSDRPYFHQALSQKTFVLSDYIVSKVNEPTVIAAFPTAAIDPQSDFVVVTSITLSWLEELIGRLTSRAGVAIALIDGQGNVLATKPPDARLIADSDLIRQVRASSKAEISGKVAIENSSSRLSYAAVRVPETRARLIVSVDEKVLLGSIDQNIRAAYLQLAAVGLLLLLGAWYLSERLIIGPIRLLSSAAARFGAGDFDARTPREGLPAEFAPLVIAFNRMASQLAERERELISSNDRLAALASLDTVSGLPNRRGFDSRLDFEWMKAMHGQTPLALAMIDIDHFKQFNDTYGHPAGDACLARVGTTIAAVAANFGAFGARYGGEEFALLLPDASRERAVKLGHEIRAAIEALDVPHAGSPAGHVTASVGVAVMTPALNGEPTELLEAADSGLYAAKRRGRNIVVEHGALRSVDAGVALAG